MEYKIIKTEDCIDGSQRMTIAVTIPKSTVVTIKNTRKMTERERVIAVFNELIRQEPATAKKQDIARKRYAYETAVA